MRHHVIWLGGTTPAVFLGVAFLVSASPHGKHDWPVPEEAKKRKNPVEVSPQVLKAGRTLYTELCAHCHGQTGKGDGPEAMMYTTKPADFTDAQMMREMSDGELFYKISEGREPMPGFKKQLAEQQRWQLVCYIRTFAQRKNKPPNHRGHGEKHGFLLPSLCPL